MAQMIRYFLKFGQSMQLALGQAKDCFELHAWKIGWQVNKMVIVQVVFNEISSKDLLSNSFLQFRPVPSVCGRYIPQIILQKLYENNRHSVLAIETTLKLATKALAGIASQKIFQA